jgi:hypothetical protein
MQRRPSPRMSWGGGGWWRWWASWGGGGWWRWWATWGVGGRGGCGGTDPGAAARGSPLRQVSPESGRYIRQGWAGCIGSSQPHAGAVGVVGSREMPPWGLASCQPCTRHFVGCCVAYILSSIQRDRDLCWRWHIFSVLRQLLLLRAGDRIMAFGGRSLCPARCRSFYHLHHPHRRRSQPPNTSTAVWSRELQRGEYSSSSMLLPYHISQPESTSTDAKNAVSAST